MCYPSWLVKNSVASGLKKLCSFPSVTSNQVQFDSCLQVIEKCQLIMSEVKWVEHHSCAASRQDKASLDHLGLEKLILYLPAAACVALPWELGCLIAVCHSLSSPHVCYKFFTLVFSIVEVAKLAWMVYLRLWPHCFRHSDACSEFLTYYKLVSENKLYLW